MTSSQPSDASGRRVERWTLLLGAGGAIIAGAVAGWSWAVGLCVGAALSWINFRWLKRGVSGMLPSAVSQDWPAKPRAAKRAIVFFFGRFVLLAVALYVILTRSLLPAGAVLAGLFAAVGGVIIELAYLLVRGFRTSA